MNTQNADYGLFTAKIVIQKRKKERFQAQEETTYASRKATLKP